MEEETSKLTFDPTTHTYTIDGKEVLSVTQVLQLIFPTKYDGVDPAVLKRASERGTFIHEAIEVWERLGYDTEECEELQNWKILKFENELEVEKNEIPVIITLGNYKIAGRLDVVLSKDGKLGLGDFKTTYNLDLEYLKLQLNLYRIGYEQTYSKKIDFIAGIHLRKEKKKYVELPIEEEQTKERIINALKENEKLC